MSDHSIDCRGCGQCERQPASGQGESAPDLTERARAVLAGLSTAQREMVQHGDLPPGGYSGAGPDASRWHRTWGVLLRLGVCSQPRDKDDYLLPARVILTDLGREVVRLIAEEVDHG